MNNTIYIADTCTLRKANAREALHKALHADADRRLLILASVREELERQLREKKEPEAAAALTFLQQEYLRVIHLPESDDYPKGAVADNEILYYCYTHKSGKIVLYTQDTDLTNSILALCPHVQVQKSSGTRLSTVAETFKQQYDTLLQPFCCVFCTAAALNLAADNGADRFLLPCKKIILSKVSLCGLTLNGHEALQAHEKQVALVSPVDAEVTEIDELTIRALTHRHKDKTVLLLLAEEEDSTPYLRNGQLLPCSRNNGFAVAVLCKDGSIRITAPAPNPQQNAPKTPAATSAGTPAPQSKKAVAVPQPKDTAKEQKPITKPQPPKQNNTAAAPTTIDFKKAIQEKFEICKKITAVSNLVAENEKTISYGIKLCITKYPDLFPQLIHSLVNKKKTFPHDCFNICVTAYLLQDKENLETKLKNGNISKALKELVQHSVYTEKNLTAVTQLLGLIKKAKGTPKETKLQELLKLAYAKGAPAPQQTAP